MKKLFFALWPDEAVRLHTAGLLRGMQNLPLKPVTPDNVHVTLVFLGNVSEEDETILAARAGEIVSAPFEMRLDRLSFWRKPQILCLTPQHLASEVLALVENINRMVSSCGLPVETRPYKPHVTLARKARSKPDMPFEPIVWRADAFCLVQSVSTEQGVHYRVLQNWPFRPG
ncbi:MAG: RNA 2',3'-cyclic phosphodiesterase [Gammaproteobacteria bacterium]